jgi:hypothetical protein
MSSELVTVVVPTFNRAYLLAATLESIVAQTVPCRVIVFDDGRDAETEAVVRRFRDVEYVSNPVRLGLFPNWNRAVDEATTEYVAVFHDDDLYAPTIVERELDVFQTSPSVVMVHTGSSFIDDHGREFDRFVGGWPRVMSGAALREVLAGRFASPIATPSVMIRRSALTAIGGFPEHLAVCGDLATWMTLAEHGDIGFVAEPLVANRARGRYANAHAAPDWGLVAERASVAEATQLAVHGRLSACFRLRRDAFLLQYTLRDLMLPLTGSPDILREHGSAGVRLVAPLLARARFLAPVLHAARPLARYTSERLARARRARLAS